VLLSQLPLIKLNVKHEYLYAYSVFVVGRGDAGSYTRVFSMCTFDYIVRFSIVLPFLKQNINIIFCLE
jgi:hypothetical protein